MKYTSQFDGPACNPKRQFWLQSSQDRGEPTLKLLSLHSPRSPQGAKRALRIQYDQDSGNPPCLRVLTCLQSRALLGRTSSLLFLVEFHRLETAGRRSRHLAKILDVTLRGRRRGRRFRRGFGCALLRAGWMAIQHRRQSKNNLLVSNGETWLFDGVERQVQRRKVAMPTLFRVSSMTNSMPQSLLVPCCCRGGFLLVLLCNPGGCRKCVRCGHDRGRRDGLGRHASRRGWHLSCFYGLELKKVPAAILALRILIHVGNVGESLASE